MNIEIADPYNVLTGMALERESEGDEDFKAMFLYPLIGCAVKFSTFESPAVDTPATGNHVVVTINKRIPLDAEPFRNPGWLEASITVWPDRESVNVQGKMILYVAAIQRTPGMMVEFHS